MGIIKGTSIVLTERTQTGYDAFGQPIYSNVNSTVQNVLIVVSEAPEVNQDDGMYHRKTVVDIGIPKGDTHKWEGSLITWKGKTYRQIGAVYEGISDMIPLSWDKKTKAERYE